MGTNNVHRKPPQTKREHTLTVAECIKNQQHHCFFFLFNFLPSSPNSNINTFVSTPSRYLTFAYIITSKIRYGVGTGAEPALYMVGAGCLLQR